MDENTNQQQQPQQQAKCPGNCSLCNMYQRNYCASQISYTNMKLITSLVKEVNDMRAEVKAMSSELAASRSQSAEELINPTSDE